jgi:hypothetical protein
MTEVGSNERSPAGRPGLTRRRAKAKLAGGRRGGDGMDEGRSKALLALSWLWVAVVAGYMAWGAINEAGLFGWLAALQIDQWGQYYPKWTAILPGLLLAAPAFWYIRRRTAIVRAREGVGPAAEARRMGRAARLTALAGLAALLAGGGAFLLSQRVPDGSEKAVPFDAARLGTAPAPDVKVRIQGRIDPAAHGVAPATGRPGENSVNYFGFRPEGTARDAPHRLFIERHGDASGELRTIQIFLPEQTGYLVENGVPPLALRDLAARGIRVASPHYLLRTGALARREPYYIAAALGGVLGFICLLVALIGAIQARSRARRARAVAGTR